MSGKNDSTAVAIVELTALLPWWGGVMLAGASYGALHFYVSRPIASVTSGNPVAIMIPSLMHGLATVGQYALPILFLIAAVMSAVRRWKRRRLLAGVATSAAPDALNGLTWREFEMLVGEAFRIQGYSVTETGSGADGGVDIVMRKDSEKYFVQCKQWRAQTVGVPIVRELYGAMVAHGATGGFVVTSGRFTKPAVDFAQGLNLTLIDGPLLHAMITKVPSDVSAEISATTLPSSGQSPECPTCGNQMTRRTASRGARAGQQFWGCTAYPSCRGTRSLP